MNTLRRHYQRLTEDLFSKDYFPPDPDVATAMSILPLIPKGSFLLTGAKGTGKSTYVAACARRFFVDDEESSMARVNCHQELMDSNVLYRISYKNPDTPPQPRNILRSRFRFIDEIARMSPNLQNAFLSFLSEEEVIFEDHHFPVPPGVTFFCRNPMDQGQDGIVTALHDRIDVEIIVPDNTYPPKNHTVGEPPRPLSTQDMKKIWQAVNEVNIDDTCWDYTHMINYYFSACMVERSTANPLFTLPCKGCAHSAEICRQLRSTPGRRALQSTFKFARALAWFDGRDQVDITDIEFAIPYTYAHRLDFHNDVFMKYQDPQLYLRSTFLQGHLDAKRSIWLRAITNKQRGNPDAILEAAKRHDDLVLAWLYGQCADTGSSPQAAGTETQP